MSQDEQLSRLVELFPEAPIAEVVEALRHSDGDVQAAVDHMLAQLLHADDEAAAAAGEYDNIDDSAIPHDTRARQRPQGMPEALGRVVSEVSRLFTQLTMGGGRAATEGADAVGASGAAAEPPLRVPEPAPAAEVRPPPRGPVGDIDTDSSATPPTSPPTDSHAPRNLDHAPFVSLPLASGTPVGEGRAAEDAEGLGEAQPSAGQQQQEVPLASSIRLVVTGRSRVGKTAIVNAMLGAPLLPTSLSGINFAVSRHDPAGPSSPYSVVCGDRAVSRELHDVPVLKMKKMVEDMVGEVVHAAADAPHVTLTGPLMLPAEVSLHEEQWPAASVPRCLSDPDVITVIVCNGLDDADVAAYAGKENVVCVSVKKNANNMNKAVPPMLEKDLLDVDPTGYLSHMILSTHGAAGVAKAYDGTFNEFRQRVWLAMGHRSAQDEAKPEPHVCELTSDPLSRPGLETEAPVEERPLYTPELQPAVPAVASNPYTPTAIALDPHPNSAMPIVADVVPTTVERPYVPAASDYVPASSTYTPAGSDYRPQVSNWQPSY